MKKFKMNTMKKRIISMALSLVMIASMLPLSLLNVSAATSANTGNNYYDSIINGNGTPDGYDPNDTSNPYGIAVGDTVRLSTQNELFLFRSYDINKDNGAHDTYLMENFKVGVGSDGMSGNLNLSGNKLSDFQTERTSQADVGYTYSFMEAVPFDPHNRGRKDHIAYVGYDEKSGKLEVGAIKADGTFVASARIDACDFLNDDVYQYQAANYLAITAGDYNGDGKDTVIVYSQSKGKDVRLWEFRLDGTDSPNAALTKIANTTNPSADTDTYRDTTLFNPDYFDVNFSKLEEHISDKLACDLATSDFNKDGIDDLAVLSYLLEANDGDTRKLFDCNAYTPWLAINYGATSGKDILWKRAAGQHICYENKVDQSNSDTSKRYVEYHTMAAAGIAAGDVDGDGYDELVIGGISAMIKSQGNNSRYSNDQGLIVFKESSRLTVFEAHNGLNRKGIEQIENNAALASDINTDNHFWQHMDIETVAINGQNAAEHIFYNGMLLTYDGSKSTKFNKVYTANWFGTDAGEDEVFIQSIAVGNFDDNGAGREQVFFTIGQRLDSDDYAYRSGVIGATYNDTYNGSTVTNYGSVKQYYSNNIAKQTPAFKDKGDNLDERLNFFMVAVDWDDNDGVTAKYKGKGYAYTDPEVQAVLQAAPYFGELGGYGDFSGSTTYGFTTTYAFSTSEGKETSWGVGVSMEVEAVAVKVALESQYLSAKNTEFENSLETSYSTEFSAGPKDSVILSRTPLITYVYEATVNGKPAEISMSVPLGPVYYSLSIEEYNEFVDAYNKYIDDLYAGYKDKSDDAKKRMENTKLKKITDSHLQNEGNPWNYQWDSDAFKVLSKNTLAYSYDGSSITSAFDETKSETITETNSEGYSIGMAVMAGFNLGGTGVVAGAMGSVEENWSTCRSETTANTTSTAGTVAGMDVMQLSEDLGVPTSALREYGFNWVFGTWDINTMGSKGKTPVFGYNLTNIKAPAEAVSNLEGVWTSDTEATLTWTKPRAATGRANADSYYVYQFIDGEFQKIAEQNTNNNGVYTVKLTGLDATQNNTYVVAGYDTETNTVGVFSNEVTLGPGDGEVEIRYNQDTDTIEWRYTNQKDWTEVVSRSVLVEGAQTPELRVNEGWIQWRVGTGEWKDLLNTSTLTTGADGKTPFIGTNGNWWIGNEDTGVKAAGADGKDGATPEIGTNGNWWIDGVDTGVKATGKDGEDGRGVVSIAKTKTEGLVDTYTITYSDKSVAYFTVTNGAQGTQGEQGIQGEKGEDGHTPVITIDSDGNWCVDGISTGIKAQGVKGDKGDKGDDGADGREVEFNVSETHIQWRYVGETAWKDLIALDLLKGADGVNGANGTNGTNGANGTNGTDGKEIELQTTATHIQWRYVGETEWNNLVSFADLEGADGQNGANGTDGKDGVDGKDGKDGADGKDGKDGLTPFIGENGNWWIGETDTGVKAAIKGDGTEDVDGDGIVSAKMNEKGELVLTLADGSTFRAINADAAVQTMAGVSDIDNGDMDTIKMIATIALILSALSLLWNAVALVISLTKKKRA